MTLESLGSNSPELGNKLSAESCWVEPRKDNTKPSFLLWGLDEKTVANSHSLGL